jgi:TRAP-type transport system small permease protein
MLVNIFKKIQDTISNIIAVILAMIMCVIILQTFTRYVIFYSLPWSEELSRYLFVVMVLLGINLAITKETMVRIDIIDGIVPKAAQYILEIVRNIIALIISLFFFSGTIGMVRVGSFQKSPALQISMNIIYSVLTIGFFLSAIALILKTAQQIISVIKGEDQ